MTNIIPGNQDRVEPDVIGIGERNRNGINVFLSVTSRATLAVPPRRLRAYPYLNRC